MAKFFVGLIVDAKLVKKRKYYYVTFGFIITLSFIFCTWWRSIGPFTIAVFLFIGHSCIVFIDSTIESMIIQQARCDPAFG